MSEKYLTKFKSLRERYKNHKKVRWDGERTHLNGVIINLNVFVGAGDGAANVQLTDTAEPVPTKILR